MVFEILSNDERTSTVHIKEKESLNGLSSDTGHKIKFLLPDLVLFWISARNGYPSLRYICVKLDFHL